ncbi:hypothetical protein HPB52_003121 [Rhipicephalus sanguineus]|uniref:Uncharacterized protein n=1 Tax=Rhipicephalus sanguineus TaxID=34632 RepID=A0A9D4PQC0_RHISA|nr:hypothetical protein HPB52_003121 [Rhipicephalus sanguineus]
MKLITSILQTAEESTRGYRASVTPTLTLLTDELQASVPNAAQLESHVDYLIQKNAELVNLNNDIFDATDDVTYEEELEAAEDCDRKVCYAVSPVPIEDIKKTYLQMLIRPEESDVLRFLRIDRLPSDADPSPTVVTWRMTRVPFGESSSPF